MNGKQMIFMPVLSFEAIFVIIHRNINDGCQRNRKGKKEINTRDGKAEDFQTATAGGPGSKNVQ